MSETRVVCLLVGGPDRSIVAADGKRYRFEDHPYCGPTALGKRGEILARQPTAFLAAATLWLQQGRRVGEDGLCVWEPEPDPLSGAVNIVGKIWMHVPAGRDPREFRSEVLANLTQRRNERVARKVRS